MIHLHIYLLLLTPCAYSARVLVDLCAAPGSWLQVAGKYMPAGSLIMGLDLVAIRPIRNVVTVAQDITEYSKCRAIIKVLL